MSPGHATASSSDHILYPFISWGFHAECLLRSSMVCILTSWFILLSSQILYFHSKSNSNDFFHLFFFFLSGLMFLAKNSFCDCWIMFWGKGSSIASACNAQLVLTWAYLIIFFLFRLCLFFSFFRTDHSKE